MDAFIGNSKYGVAKNHASTTTLLHLRMSILKTRILYIEDDQAIAALFKSIVEGLDCVVDLASNGTDDLNLHESNPYDALVVDYQLPDMTGLDICAKLLKKEPELPISIITGMQGQRIAIEALALGATNYLYKDGASEFLELLPPIIEHLKKRVKDRNQKKAYEVSEEIHRQHFIDAAQLSNMGFWLFDVLKNSYVSFSDEFARIHGMTPNELETRFSTAGLGDVLTHPDDLAHYREHADRFNDYGEGYDINYRLIGNDG